MQIDTDADSGAPVMFARAPGQVATQPESSGAVLFRGAASGNKNFDPVTGKFAGKKLNKLEVVAQTVQEGAPAGFRSGIPNGVDPLVWERRLDAVRDAAREDEMLTPVTAMQFLTGRVAVPAQVNIAAFLDDVTAQRIADVADALDYSYKPKRDRPSVKVAAPAGWIRRVMAELTPPQTLHLVKRLEGRGWSPEDVKKLVIDRIRDPEKKKALQQLYGETPAKEGKSGDKTPPQ
jgi:hypothetical protein